MKMTIHTFCAACFLGALALTSHAATAETATGCGMSCCGAMATTVSDAATNVVPDKLTTCPVSGDKLGEMGKPYTFTYKGQEVKLCCSGCKKDFDKEPEKYMAKIRAADKK